MLVTAMPRIDELYPLMDILDTENAQQMVIHNCQVENVEMKQAKSLNQFEKILQSDSRVHQRSKSRNLYIEERILSAFPAQEPHDQLLQQLLFLFSTSTQGLLTCFSLFWPTTWRSIFNKP